MNNPTNTPFTRLSLGFQIGETFKLIGKMIAQEVHRQGMTMEQYILLHGINSQEEVTQQELAKRFHKDKSGILRITDELERKKLVVRMMDERDRRKKTLMLTKKGVELLQELREAEAKVMERMLHGVQDEELEAFSRVLSILQRNASD